MANLNIQAPRSGISSSPHVGFAECVNLDIDSIPGIVRLNNIMAKKSGTTVDAQVKWFARDPDTSAIIFALDSNGVLYKSANSGATWAEISDRGGTGQGLIVQWGYVFVAEETTMDIMRISDSSWTNNWAGLTMDTDADWHPMIVSKLDGKIYGGAGKYVFTIKQDTTFDPANAATYTVTAQALDLPASYRIKCLEELGNNLMIGTWKGTNVYDIREATIFTWDGNATTYGQPIVMAEYGVHAMLNTGSTLIVLAGINGTVFGCDGVNTHIIGQIPTDLSGGKYLEWYPGSICSYKNKVFFGTGQGGTTAIPGQGIYSLQQTGRGNILNLEHTVSTLNTGILKPLKVSALLPVTRDTLLSAWRDDTTYGIDLTTATSYAYGTDYSGYFITPQYTVGSALSKTKFKEIEFLVARLLRTGEGIKLEYRLDLTSDFTTIKTFAYTDANVGSVVAKNIITEKPHNIKEGEQVQFKISLLGTTTTTPELKSIIVK